MDNNEEYDGLAHHPSTSFVKGTNVRAFMEEYEIPDDQTFINRTTTDIDWFWDVIVDYLDIEFYEQYDAVRDDTNGPQFTAWYPGGEFNIAHNVLDRHGAPDAESRNQTAIIHENEHGTVQRLSFNELYKQANRVANTLRRFGVGVGDTVGLYMPMVPSIVPVMYGCFKAGAVVVPLFSGFGTEAIRTRLDRAECSLVFTVDGYYRREQPRRPLSKIKDVLPTLDTIESIIVKRRISDSIPDDDRFSEWESTVNEMSWRFDTESLSSQAESMILFTSGTTGPPKGTIHTHTGQLLQAAKEIYFGFDHKPDDRFFWVTDTGWIMASWSLIGNHAFGGTAFMYSGAPDYPSPDRYWELIDRHSLTVFGISPTVIRTLRESGDDTLDDHDLSSLRLLGSTGEPWDSDSWEWFYQEVGQSETPIINITGGTEIFGCFLMPMPTQALKPCTVGKPSPGMNIDIVNRDGESVKSENKRGFLVARDSCPSMTKSLLDGDDRYLSEYWSKWENMWDHGDWAQCDEDGFWYLHGRTDDVLNIAGRRAGPAEVESIVNDHRAVNESAAIGVSNKITGESLFIYITLTDRSVNERQIRESIKSRVTERFGKPFRPSGIRIVEQLPENQSGKILRSVIRTAHEDGTLPDPATVRNPEALREIG